MRPGQSGEGRVARAVDSAEAMEDQARQLLLQAERVRAGASRIAKGNEGERVIGRLLEQLQPQGWVVLHDRRKQPGSPANLDHVLVGPPGVFVIDAKNWTGGRLRFDDRGMAVGRWRKDDELHSAKVDADIVGAHVHALVPHAQTVGVVAFVQDMGLAVPVQHKQVLLMQREQLLPGLHRLPAALTAEQVARLAAALDVALPPRVGSAARSRASTPAAGAPASASGAPTPAPAPPAPAPAPAPVRAQTTAERRRSARRENARRELRAGATKLAIMAVLVPVVPWVAEHIASAVTPTVISQLAPPTATRPAPATGP